MPFPLVIRNPDTTSRPYPFVILVALCFGTPNLPARENRLNLDRRQQVRTTLAADVAADVPFTGPQLLNEFATKALGPGAYMIGRARAHEIDSVRILGRLFASRFRCNLILIAGLGGWDVPAYDGVILNENQVIIGNFSLKRMHADSPGDNLSAAMGMAVQYSRSVNWISHILRQPLTAGDEDLARTIHAHRQMMRIFVGRTPRPTTIIVDQPGPGPLNAQLTANAVHASSFRPIVPGVMILRDDRLVTFMAGETASMALDDCARDLAPRRP